MTVSQQEEAQPIHRGRYRRIIWFFAGVAAHLIWWDLIVGRIARGWVRRTRPERFRRLSRRFRELAVAMGGVMIKLGQFLSSRVDVLPVEITEELKGLQDEVPAVHLEQIQAVLRAELGDLSTHFAEIETAPQAAASLGQTHRAWLLPAEDQTGRGAAVVVKVQRPDIEEIVRTDLAALQTIAPWVMRYRPIRRRADVPALMGEFARTLWEELDYHAEADNAERFRRMFARDPGVRIPAIYREHSTGRVLVLENVEAIKITDVAAMVEVGINSKQVANRLFEVYFRQIFKECFFHADPHPGNLFVEPVLSSDGQVDERPRPFRLIFVDFGMVGRVPALMGDNLRQLLISVTRRDARALTEAYNDLGFFLPGADLERIAEAQAALLDKLWGRKLLDMSRPDPGEVQEMSREFRDILFDFPFQVPQDFIYLGRAMGMLSGLVSLLDPDINPWYQIEKFGRELIESQSGQHLAMETVVEWLRPLVTLPGQLQRVLNAAEAGHLRVQTTPDRNTTRRLERLENRVRQLQWSLLAGALLIAGALLYVDGETTLSLVAWGSAALLLVASLLWRRE